MYTWINAVSIKKSVRLLWKCDANLGKTRRENLVMRLYSREFVSLLAHPEYNRRWLCNKFFGGTIIVLLEMKSTVLSQV